MPSTPDLRPRAWRLFVETHAALFGHLVDQMRVDVGIPMTWYDVLLHLAEVEGGRLRMHELADAVLLSKSGLTTLVDRMEAAGLVRREVPAGDRRAIDVVLTDAGRRRFQEAAAVHRRGIDAHFCAHLSQDETAALIALLERLRSASPRSARVSERATR